MVTFESDWRKAKEILSSISKKHSEHVSKAAARKFKETSKLFMMYKPDFNPQVYTKVEDSGVLLTIRYLCNPRKRRITSQMIWEDILDQFVNYDNIDFAYPTTRFYQNNENINK